jgi:hypothetical protein
LQDVGRLDDMIDQFEVLGGRDAVGIGGRWIGI